nr:MAG TPA: hypothetical protein [Caudoviricetes sp.]
MECDTHIYIFFISRNFFSMFYLQLCLFNT